jgi:hypothetical protein
MYSGGFACLNYWLENEQMALQHTQGKPGPDAVSMAKQLLALPHDTVLSR